MENQSAIGYMILAAQALGLSVKQTKELESEMQYQMDTRTEEQAQDTYNKF